MSDNRRSTVNRVLDAHPVASWDDYVATGGGAGLAAAAELDPVEVIAVIKASGLRGRGGAGFPTGVKWQTVLGNESFTAPTSVVVNAAEGEPGTFKDRTLLRTNPYRVLEGALIAAYAVSAPRVVVAMKGSFERELERMRTAVEELREARVATDVTISVVEGPDSYLFGEETGLLEVIDGRGPFPRVAPPYRRGIEPEDRNRERNMASNVQLATESGSAESPALANNVETLAHVSQILAHGADWFRELGTEHSPGTFIATVSGDTTLAGVGEFPMGVTLQQVIDDLGGAPKEQHRYVAAVSGTANAMIPAERFDTPVTYEHIRDIGSGLGSAGFLVFDEETDLVAVAAGIAHFLAVESCGQCEPCKSDGAAISTHLDMILSNDGSPRTLAALSSLSSTVSNGARCGLGRQQEDVTTGALKLLRTEFREHVQGRRPPVERVTIAPIADLAGDEAILDDRYADKNLDWTHGGVDSGETPVDRLRGASPEITEASQERPKPVDEAASVGKGYAFELLDIAHEAMRSALDNAQRSEGEERLAHLDELERILAIYLDVGQRILFPMLRRVAAVPGDDAAWTAAYDADAAEQCLTLVREARGVGNLDDITADIEVLIAEEEMVVEPLLSRHLSDADIVELGNAMQATIDLDIERNVGAPKAKG
ncbi:NADH-ubiquinone oxidoreductase-F iron-sulfur binding region domain-containing protein [Candidatus Neomicrothrix sp.]|uniref:NADH-ubiquinone oxidoreductase-F iron-sulfur binding region domain-containing protein n=1 Tax=Candidatus Neomicrothrix sp. TaxID=2719034 RepID=UPI0025927D16|nr:NADH-ubiquinone oxidoreductase-F iron-sulfur binding region domain-containing protein [Candidatus Microthrix sp.]HMS49634.1 NADH-ubiquinone oxidoreductase-F iron-sulfur binding region domain-containing protein [Candidatus Microthrix sp.]